MEKNTNHFSSVFLAGMWCYTSALY